MKEKNSNGRLMSLDTLRGLDMFFLMGFAGLVTAITKFWPDNNVALSIAAQMDHVQWNGLADHDTIFPVFLFIAGISFPFSLAKQRERGHTEGQILYKTIKRGIILVLLGIMYNGFFDFDFTNLRIASVLGRIGLAWMFSALLFMKFKTKVLAVIAPLILIGYWLAMWLIPGGSDPFSYENNLVGMIDRVLLPGHLYENNFFDPEGLFSTLPAIVTAMLGMFTGKLVRLPENKLSGLKKCRYLVIGGLALLVIGYAWSLVFPLNKKLWTSSFVCVVAGYPMLVFALFYYLIDIKQHRQWTLFFRVIGMNSITIYLTMRIIDYGQISKFFLNGLAKMCGGTWVDVINTIGYILVGWLYLYFLYNKKIFLKV
jgi:predicted acyltransferase